MDQRKAVGQTGTQVSAANVVSPTHLAGDRALLDAIPANVAQIGADGHIVAVNRRWEVFASENKLSMSDAAIGEDYLAVCERMDLDGAPASKEAAVMLREVLAGTRESASFIYPCHSADNQRWFRVTFSALVVNGRQGALAMHFDITQEVVAEQRLFELAHFDSLTGLPNRLLFLDRLRNRIALAQRYDSDIAVLSIDIDRFKAVNDTLGHDVGDLLLQQFARRIAEVLRHSDVVGHLGGDKFSVIVADAAVDNAAAAVAGKLMTILEQPFSIAGQTVFVSASIGIALFPGDTEDAEGLMHFADTAVFRAKEVGRNCFQYYTSAMNTAAQERMLFDADLRQALFRNEFELFYQPKVSCGNGEIVGLEALLRWRHPVRGLVSPVEFVPVLEEIGLINRVGRWVLNEACAQLKRWMDQGLGRPTMAVNISAHQLDNNELQAAVLEALKRSGVPADCLELELTESALMRNVEAVIVTMQALRRLGVRFAVDDFGTGYSSLAYLKRLPLDAVKVDRSFIQDITADPDDASITKAVITLAHNLKLKVIASGVETEGQLALLVANHCDQIQGFFFSHPLPAVDIAKILANRCTMPGLPDLPSRQQRTMLIVDDEESILASLRRLLRRDGYRILTANSGEAGLELLAENKVDVILSDQRMPGMMGVEFLRRVKTMHPQTVRMVLSGYTELQSITDAINEGAIYKFLTKPWDDDLLRANIEEAFRHKELSDENRHLQAEVQSVNIQLAMANVKLLDSLAEKDRRIERDETTLDIVQEIMQCIPFPVLGFDDEDLVVFANIEAIKILGSGVPLLGNEASECLPESLVRLIQRGDGDTVDWLAGAIPYRALYRRLARPHGGGRLLILFSTPACPVKHS